MICWNGINTCAPSPALTALGNVAWWCGNSGNQTHLVGAKTANPWNLKEVHGNVFEWRWDIHGDYLTEAATDYTGPLINPAGKERVYRGGGFKFKPNLCRSAYRGKGSTSSSWNDQGFRGADFTSEGAAVGQGDETGPVDQGLQLGGHVGEAGGGAEDDGAGCRPSKR